MRSEDIEELAAYNSETTRGKVFPLEVQERMAKLQNQFDELSNVSVDRATGRATCRICSAEGDGYIVHTPGCRGPEYRWGQRPEVDGA